MSGVRAQFIAWLLVILGGLGYFLALGLLGR
jgi:hypothetical protein